MTLKLVIRESESPRPVASSILISGMTSSSVIIPYIVDYRKFYASSIPSFKQKKITLSLTGMD